MGSWKVTLILTDPHTGAQSAVGPFATLADAQAHTETFGGATIWNALVTYPVPTTEDADA